MDGNPCRKERDAFKQATKDLNLCRQSGPNPSDSEIAEPIEVSEELLKQWEKNVEECKKLVEKWRAADHALNECQKRHGVSA